MVRSSWSLMFSLVAFAGCATEELAEPTGAQVEDADECHGLEVPADDLTARLELEAGGQVAVHVHNHAATELTARVTLHAHRGDALARAGAPAIVVAPGGDAVVRLALADVGVDPARGAGLKAEVVAVGAGGAEVRAFAALAVEGGSTARRPLPAAATVVDGEPAVLAATVVGARGIDPTTLGGAHDDDGTAVALGTIASPGTYDMCFRWPVSLVDAGYGEDFGVDPTDPWRARGGRVKVFQGGVARFDGYLDGNGCTGGFWSPSGQDLSIYGYSRARVGGNDVIVRNNNGVVQAFEIGDADPGPDLTPTYVFPETNLSTILAAATFTMQRIEHGLTNQVITLENRCQPGGGCCNCANSSGLWITSPFRKFLIAHEIGHRLLALDVGPYDNDVSFDLDPTNVSPVCDTASTHSMWSMELESGAAMEGWAHFVAVTAFNSTAGPNPGAIIRYWSAGGDTTVDVEQGPTGGASNYYDTVCPVSPSITRRSVQLDWLRHWWDYLTNATDVDPGARPSWAQLTNEIGAALPWSAGTTWSRLSAAVTTTSGADQGARWSQHGAWNGIN